MCDPGEIYYKEASHARDPIFSGRGQLIIDVLKEGLFGATAVATTHHDLFLVVSRFFTDRRGFSTRSRVALLRSRRQGACIARLHVG